MQNTVHSYDLVAANEHVVACDIANVPLEDASIDVGIFCLSLMGTNFVDYLREAHRVIVDGGRLKIAEVLIPLPNSCGWYYRQLTNSRTKHTYRIERF